MGRQIGNILAFSAGNGYYGFSLLFLPCVDFFLMGFILKICMRLVAGLAAGLHIFVAHHLIF